MSEREDRSAGERAEEGQEAHLDEDLEEGASPGTVGAAGGGAAAGSLGAVSGPRRNGVMPEEAPDPTVGPD
jgi:hypothetical protein